MVGDRIRDWMTIDMCMDIMTVNGGFSAGS
jgi:hypothetical protein